MEINIPTPMDSEKMRKVAVESWGCVASDQERKPASSPLRFTRRESVDPQYRPSRIIRPVPRSRIHLPIGTETGPKYGDNQVVWVFQVSSILEPSNNSSKSDGGVERLWVGNASEDP